MNMSVFSRLLEAVLQLTLVFKISRHLFVSSIGHQDSDIEALESIVYQHHWIDQEVILDMAFEKKNAFYFNFDVKFGLVYHLLLQMGSMSCHKKTHHVSKMAVPCAKPKHIYLIETKINISLIWDMLWLLII